MLNLNDPIRYTDAEQTHVDSILKPLKKDGWKDQKKATKAIKHRISTHTIIAQGGRCAYCESILRKGAHAIEHIAPKSLYGEFCYEPYNLVTACTSCNSTANKGENDTVINPVNRNDYAANRFNIVHPYFDNPNNHFKYLDADKTSFDKSNCTPEALETIRMMHWDEWWAFGQRVAVSRTRDIPVPLLQLVAEITTYRP